MKHTHYLFTICLTVCYLLQSTTEAQSPGIPMPRPLSGNVKYVYNTGDESQKIHEYDSSGRISCYQPDLYGCNDLLGMDYGSSEWCYVRDAAGRLSGASHHFTYAISAPEPGEETDHTTDYSFTYDKRGRLSAEFWSNSFIMSPPGGRTQYRYVKDTLLKSRDEYMYNGLEYTHESRETFQYDRRGRLTKHQEYEEYGGPLRLMRTHISEYDDRRHTEESYSLLPGSAEKEDWELTEKDAEGRVYRTTWLEDDTLVSESHHYRYDSALTWHDKLFHKQDKVVSRSVECHNLQGDLVRRIYYQADKTVDSDTQFIFEYDVQGNWVRVTRRREGWDDCVEERKIVYWRE